MRAHKPRLPETGQVLPITALLMVVLLLFAALAIDVTGVLSAERFYTTTADAAALAGAQDLQQGKKRTVTTAERTRARTHAMQVLVDELGATFTPSDGSCRPQADITGCALPGTPYLVSVVTPAPYCVRCDQSRAVKVTIRNPAYGLTFTRLIGQDGWNVESAAVAGLEYPGKYALIALKPFDTNFQDGVEANGGTVVRVVEGDIGTNTNADLAGSGSMFDLTDGYIDYRDDSVGAQWGSDPPGRHIPDDIPDPQIPEPSFLGAPVFRDQADGEAASCPPEVLALATVPADVVCYRPGVYEARKNNDQFVVGSKDKVYLLGGVYKFEGGLDVGGELYGGLVPGQPGVTIFIPDDKELDAESAEVIRLNTSATPAFDWGAPPRPMVNDEGLLVTFYVPRIPACFSGSRPIPCVSEPKGEPDFKLAGTAAMYIKGVIYAPTEQVRVTGNSDSNAIDGQIIGWTLSWRGGSTLNLNYPEFEQIGLLRLDAACTGTERCS